MSLRKLSGLMLLAVAGTPATADAQQALQNLEKQLTQPPVASAPAEEPGYLGIFAEDRDTQGRGVRLTDVLASGPAAKAGLQVGDLITSIDGVQVRTLDDMAKIMMGRVVNEEVSFVATRGIEAIRVDVVLTKRPPPEERRFANFGRIGDPNTPVAAPGTPGVVTTPIAPTPPSAINAPSVPSADSLPPPEAIASVPKTSAQAPAMITPALPRGAKATLPPAPPAALPLAPSSVTPTVPSTAPVGSAEVVDPDAPLTPIAPGDELSPANGRLRTGLLGVRTTRITPEVQLAYNLPQARGALVVEVRPDSPAKLAGIPVDAVIVAAGGRRVDIPDDLAAAVAERGPGAELRLSYYRFGQLYEKTVTLVAPPPVIVTRPVVVAEVPSLPVPGPSPAKMEPSVGLPPSTVPPAAVPPSTQPPTTTPAPLVPPFGSGPTLAPSAPTVSVTTPKPATSTPTVGTPVMPPKDSETAEIRRQIRELEAQLKALEKRLPPEEKK